ncbi:hypothetical protein KUTeg_013033 [Tegillarca granosa]|uniref:FYVE-type domain-containing protein n=1 Tax=Tegillarca granosa TaxID=220873 RepID=A0ABQ9ESY0_TEGGR|nr:hypothetical protein KUTeg_013033 [Tegillarca granosa]
MAAPEKKLVKSKSGLRMVPVKDIHTSPFTLSEPPWVPDNECVSCMQCQARFDFRRRRHHCRRCGKCFCNACCENKELLQRMCFIDPVRHCFGCSGQFVIPESDQSVEEGSLFNCKLSSDHREVSFDGENDKHEPVQVEKIESVQILTTGIDTEEFSKTALP